MKTLTRMDLAEILHEKIGLSRNDSSNLLENVLTTISNDLIKGETVKLSSFGTFSVLSKSERIGRNPKTGEEVMITPRRVLTFRPSQLLKRRVEQGSKS